MARVGEAGQVPQETTQQAIGFPALFLLVVLGALLPVVPTGALVSTASVVAFHQSDPFALLVVFALASSAAFLGDIGLYWLGLRGVRSKNGSKWLQTLRGRAAPDHLERARRGLTEHRSRVLVLSRLVPAGRIPVMLACLLAEMPMRRFARGDVPACLSWAAAYQLIGILGGTLFPEPWQGVVAAVALALLISGAPAAWRRIRRT
ncbi:DedA family protein [Streptomyces hypolithicus]